MKLFRLVVIGVTLVLSLLSLSAIPASAMPRSKGPCVVQFPLVPRSASARIGGYCTNPTWRPYANDAVAWSLAHPHWYQRGQVPYPSTHSLSYKKYRNETYVVYIVQRKPRLSGHWTVSKYGLTRVAPWQHRANIGKNLCSSAYYKCKIDWVGTTHGWFAARYLEASMIKQYERAHGVCPPGQFLSCR